VFVYTTIVNIIERPEGIKIASFFIGAIILTSLISRVARTTELRVESITLDDAALQMIEETGTRPIRLVANRRDKGDVAEYQRKEKEVREDNHIPADDRILFLEVEVCDASKFADELIVSGRQVDQHRILNVQASAVPNAIAALLLHIRDRAGVIPHVYFGWTEGNPIMYLIRYIAFGEGDTAPVTREVLRKAEHDPDRRPAVHVGG
jgi:hypothetical protein